MNNLSIFSSSLTGGAGIAAMRLHQALLDKSINSHYFAKHINLTGLVNSSRVATNTTLLSSSHRQKLSALSCIEKSYTTNNKSRVSDVMFDTSLFNELDISEIPFVRSSDIVHIHWTSLFFGPKVYKKLANLGVPLVFTMHDEWLYTGGCHYTSGCNQYLSSCNSSCPQILSDPFGFVEDAFKSKYEMFNTNLPLIITPSQWLRNRVSNSSILKDCESIVIPNAFPDSFHYREPKLIPQICRDHVLEVISRVSRDSFCILLAAADLNDRRKGFDRALSILNLFHKLLVSNNSDASIVKVLLLGRATQLSLELIPFDVISVGSLDDLNQIACIYSISDIFLNPTREDNYPNVIVESLLCGTPVLSFDVGGVNEIVNSTNGVLSAEGDIVGLCLHLYRFFKGDLKFANRETISKNAREIHSYQAIASRHIEAYSAISRKKQDVTDKSFFDIKPLKLEKVPCHLGGLNESLIIDLLPMVNIIDDSCEKESLAFSTYKDPLPVGKFFSPTDPQFSLLTHGWSQPEPQGVWSCQPFAGLFLPLPVYQLPECSNSLVLRITAKSYGLKQSSVVEIPSVGKQRIDLVEKPSTVSLRLGNLAYWGGSQLCFGFPHARNEANGSGRYLGIFVFKFGLFSI